MILKEEINRIKEMMGLKLITEQGLVGKYVKDYLEKIAKNIVSTPATTEEMTSLIKKTGKSIDYTGVKDMFDSISRGYKSIDDYPEVDWYKLIDEMLNDDKISQAFKSNFYSSITSDPRVKGLRVDVDKLKELTNVVRNTNSPNLTEKVNKLIDDFNKIIDDVFGEDPELVKIIKKQAGILDIKKIEVPSQTSKEVTKDVVTKSVDNVVSDVVSTATKNWDKAVENEAIGGFRIYATADGLRGVDSNSEKLIKDSDFKVDPRMYETGKVGFFTTLTNSKVYIIPMEGNFGDAVGRGGYFSVALEYPKNTTVTLDMVKPALEAKAKEVSELLNSVTQEGGKLNSIGMLSNKLGVNDIGGVPFGKTN